MIIMNNSISLKKKTQYLKPGDRVGLICPAGIINEERIARAIANMQSLGLEPVLGKNILNQSGYLAGKDQERLYDLMSMYKDQSIQAVWCIRGGYGCTRLLPHIDFDIIRSNPKPILGYSDVTAFHHSFTLKAGIPAFHSPVASSEFSPYTLENLKKVILGSPGQTIEIVPSTENDQLYLEGKSLYERYVIQNGVASGRLWGGNLSLLSAMCGTEYLKVKKDILLYIEDIDEAPYRIDRMLTQLFQSIPMDKVKGIVLGVSEGCEKKENAQSYTLKEVLMERVGRLGIPAAYGFSFGHITHQFTIPVGAVATMNTEKFNLMIEL